MNAEDAILLAKDAILLDRADHVATVLRSIQAGETVSIAGPDGTLEVTAIDVVPIFHKIAMKALEAGSDVLKYGESIGVLVTDVDEGALVHVHNLRSRCAARSG